MNISKLIKVLRFPLTVLVVYIHFAPAERIDTSDLLALEMPLRVCFYTFFSFLLFDITVPLFFAFSGYLYFRKQNGVFTLADYCVQNKKRVVTLLAPYLLWNALTVLSNIAYEGIKCGNMGGGTTRAIQLLERHIRSILGHADLFPLLLYTRPDGAIAIGTTHLPLS